MNCEYAPNCKKNDVRPHLLFGLLKRIGVEVRVLEGGDETLLTTSDVGVEGFDLVTGIRRQGVRQFGDGWQQPGSVHLQFTVLFAQAELDREEVALRWYHSSISEYADIHASLICNIMVSFLRYRGEFLHFFVTSSQRCQTQFLRKLGETRISQQRHVTQ